MYKCSNMILKYLIRVDKKKQSVKIKKNRKCQKGEQNILIVSLRFIQKKICFGPHFTLIQHSLHIFTNIQIKQVLNRH
jgi:hypothetical protein